VATRAGWIRLDGSVNTRDLGGLPTLNGQRTRLGKLIRSDNLQDLTEADVRELVERRKVRTVIDLRTQVEVDSEGPGPLTRDGRVAVHHLSLFPEAGHNTDVTAADSDGPVVLPWQNTGTQVRERRSAVGTYLRYLEDRPDSIVQALRLIGQTAGATIVHCAAGKDRTGVVIALALDEVGVDRAAIVEDYVRTGERLGLILQRLLSTPTYAGDIDTLVPDRHAPQPATMQRLLSQIDAEYGGTSAWLGSHGWSDRDTLGLRRALVG
jgi:protein-tyrosine phosphatase